MQNSQRVLVSAIEVEVAREQWRGQRNREKTLEALSVYTWGRSLCAVSWVLEEKGLSSTSRGFGTQANMQLQAAPHVALCVWVTRLNLLVCECLKWRPPIFMHLDSSLYTLFHLYSLIGKLNQKEQEKKWRGGGIYKTKGREIRVWKNHFAFRLNCGFKTFGSPFKPLWVGWVWTGFHLIHSICLAEGKLKWEPNSRGSLREARSHCIENYMATWLEQRVFNVLVYLEVILLEFCNCLGILGGSSVNTLQALHYS